MCKKYNHVFAKLPPKLKVDSDGNLLTKQFKVEIYPKKHQALTDIWNKIKFNGTDLKKHQILEFMDVIFLRNINLFIDFDFSLEIPACKSTFCFTDLPKAFSIFWN